MGPTEKPSNCVTVTGDVPRLVHHASIPSVIVTTAGSIVAPSMVIGTVAAGNVPISVAEGDATSVGDGAPAPALVPTAEGLAIAVAVDVLGGVALAGDVGLLVAIGVIVAVGVDGWVSSRTTIVPVTLLTLSM